MYVCTPAYIIQHPTAIMNDGIMPVPDEVLKYRSLLFDLATSITLLAEEFDKVWPLFRQFIVQSSTRCQNGLLLEI
jgi:hypothetical protein